MNKIIDFLQSQSKNEILLENSISKIKLSKSLSEINRILFPSEFKEKRIFKLKTSPVLKKGQIWLCKQQYYDVFGNEILGNIPYLVIIVSNIEKIGNEIFVRIQPISPFIEFRADDEIFIQDDSIVGFDFIIETWNEQPILTCLLDEFIGIIDIETFKIDETELSLTKLQKEFRKAEIGNTAYLRQSINSFLEFDELEKGKLIFLNIDNSIIYPNINEDGDKFISMVSEPQGTFLQAAKNGRLNDRPTYLFEKTINEIEIKFKVIKEDEKYILSIKHPLNVELKDIAGTFLKQTSPNLYVELSEGLYFISISGIENKIRIILK